MADTGDGAVQVAYLHPHHVSHSWHESMMRLVAHDAANHSRILATAGPFMIRADSGGLVEARNLAVKRFLDDTSHEWLWLIDTDMGFLPDTIDRLVDTAKELPAKAVGALCFGWRELEYDGMGGRRAVPVPTLYDLAETPEGHKGFATRWTYPQDAVIQVAATGAACLLLHRQLLTAIRDQFGEVWFDRVRYEDGRAISEDLSFCYRIGSVGERLFVHTGIPTTHHKELWVSETDYQQVMPVLQRLADEQLAAAKAGDGS